MATECPQIFFAPNVILLFPFPFLYQNNSFNNSGTNIFYLCLVGFGILQVGPAQATKKA